MLLAAFLLFLMIPIRYVWALNVTFPFPPTAAQNNTFLWTREQGDPGKVWLRIQKLDDDHGATPWSGDSDSAQLDLTSLTGSAQIHLNRAGLFNVGTFEMEDNSNQDKGMSPISIKQVTVSVNPTSAGAISGTSPTPPPASASSPVSSGPPKQMKSTQMPSHEKYEAKTPNVALIVGLTLGFTTLLAIAVAAILYFRYRRRRKTDTTPPSVTPFSDTTVYNVPTDIAERKRQMIAQREGLEGQSQVYEQAPQTSPANNQTVDTGPLNRRGDDTMQELRQQMAIVTQRMATLEAGLEPPPDYRSQV
ncbi:hypothetical protein E1B28_013092 [Marasmius oreades]|uniref:Uncharacterized protein n=1 Tax=Marasmius oreades TaxID=181124 RepID=A0A9P7RPW7_9AGAR|nr:uncharacterized protein E1B28_013092 [Marasmius oreades]KAG7087111.1 hypothetical protein E1B28_013092 [Marasmius oreades]